jgi:hypothetical protein
VYLCHQGTRSGGTAAVWLNGDQLQLLLCMVVMWELIHVRLCVGSGEHGRSCKDLRIMLPQ